MKKITLFSTILFLSIAAIGQEQPQEPTTFDRHDTLKVVLHSYADSTTLEEKKVKAYKIIEIRKGDMSGKLYSYPKRYLSQQKKPLIENFPIFSEVIFAWKEEKKK